METINYPTVGVTKSKKVFVSFYLNNKRYRLFNGKRINSNLNPNSFPVKDRDAHAKILANEVYTYIQKGGVLKEYRGDEVLSGTLTDLEYFKKAVKSKLDGEYSNKYKQTLLYLSFEFEKTLSCSKITEGSIRGFLNNQPSKASYNSVRRHLSALISEAVNFGMDSNPMAKVKAKKAKAHLNKPFDDISIILKEIKTFNYNLYLCCIMTYGCLLRPHREVRELTWGDFTVDLSYIKLSGSRNKSGRNRIVPVPSYIRELLNKGDNNLNIFTGTTKAPNPDYFKTIWGRFKKVSKLLEQDQTLYSFRHSGAIEIYKRTGSLSKLQKAMGHSSLAVSLTYLRGLEVSELEESDMPKY